jgi:hypothetical protein
MGVLRGGSTVPKVYFQIMQAVMGYILFEFLEYFNRQGDILMIRFIIFLGHV